MKKIILGRTGIAVTELCFGALPLGPLQRDAPQDAAAEIISYGLKAGINFVDTAQMYGTQQYIRLAMEKSGIRPVICTKSTAKSYEDMQSAVENALRELDVETIDIFLLHAARADDQVLEEERVDALKCLLDYREKGLIKAVGISTHVIGVVQSAAKHPEIDIVFPLINRQGKGVLGGTREEMEQAIDACYEQDKGVFLMKVLGGGSLIKDYQNAMDYATAFSRGRFPLALGMLNQHEVDMNLKYLAGGDISEELQYVDENKKLVLFKGLCTKCGACIAACHSDAIEMLDAHVGIDQSKCLNCGYCVSACPQFAIRMA